MIDILTHAPGLDISQRNVTVSTCGLVPKIYELADLKLQITLAISLHAVNDEKRRELMPIANTYSIEENFFKSMPLLLQSDQQKDYVLSTVLSKV